MGIHLKSVFAVLLFASVSTVAEAALLIGDEATSNVSCVENVCIATAREAKLNVNDLETMLAAGAVTVASGRMGKTLTIVKPFSWDSGNALTLDSYRSIAVNAWVGVGGGSLTLKTDDRGSGGTLSFGAKGRVTFGNLSDHLTIDGQAYTLVGDVKTLAHDVAANPGGYFALAADYDAAGDGVYDGTATNGLGSVFEGLGNHISHIAIRILTFDVPAGFAGYNVGTVRDLALESVDIVGGYGNSKNNFATGGLAGINVGTIIHCFTSGSVSGGPLSDVGGLVGRNTYGQFEEGMIFDSGSSARVTTGYHSNGGGLVGLDFSGRGVTDSYATGNVKEKPASKLNENSALGGLVGWQENGVITNSYATGAVFSNSAGRFGGLLGYRSNVRIESSYSTGVVRSTYPTHVHIGGLVGYDQEGGEWAENNYWVTTTSRIKDPSRGVGNFPNAPGITGLTARQMRLGLPPGFDPAVWGKDSAINSGFPYLLANLPH